MHLPTRKLARLGTLAAIPLALLGAGVLVSTASYSAFSATTSNGTNNWTAGTVALKNDLPNSAAFTADNLKPGSAGSNCIVVTSSGSLPASVKLYATTATQTNSLGSWVNLHVTQGTGGGNGTCSGFTAIPNSATYNNTLDAFITNSTSFGTGFGDWVTSGANSEPRTYRISFDVAGNAPSSAMGGTVKLNFTWEAQNQ
ncbi:hypothetical protein QE418_001117 [Microbacterium testaceum]|uniref:hypothetical protein n=1 Tax=Microbacterium TaxID=33882 RepID=UPI0027876AF0|nr:MULTISPECIES: hypothetical protein [Microbacterium]MDQ1111669.1 hypothetical protein [Microbacterium testaceum]MDR6097793.1 hypothetical protein [Microbacterium sp. SORGH_AS_0454]